MVLQILSVSPSGNLSQVSEVQLPGLWVSSSTHRFKSMPLKSYIAIAAKTSTITKTSAQILAIEGSI
jgi:hypothetical protein